MLVLMHLYEGFDVVYILSYSHNHTHAADTSAVSFTNVSICLNRTSSAQAKRARAAHHLSWVFTGLFPPLLTKPPGPVE